MASSYWDDYVTGLLHSIAPAPYIPSQASGWAFQGQTWPIATHGDTLRTWVEPHTVDQLALLGQLDRQSND